MKKSFILGATFALALVACGDDSPSSSNSANPELESSSSVEETPSSSSEKSSSSSKKSKDSSSSNKVSESSSSVEQECSSAEQESSSSEKVQSSSEAVEESSSSELGDTTAVNTSSSTEDVSSSSGLQELDVQVSINCFADYPIGEVPTPTTKAYIQPDSSGRYSGTLYYVVDNCRRQGGTLSKTMSGDTLVMKFVDVQASSYCLCWSDFAISYGSALENIKYIDYTAPYAKHSTYEVVYEPDPGKPPMPESSSSMSVKDLLSSARALESSSSSF